MPISVQRQNTETYLQRSERIVNRVGTVHDVFHEWSPDILFLDITVPEMAALPIDQIIFETVSHDQSETCALYFWTSIDCMHSDRMERIQPRMGRHLLTLVHLF